MHEPFPASQVDRVIRSGETVNLGNLTLTPVATPGHTPGALSWQWQSCENNRCLFAVYADSLSPISSDNYQFSDHPGYVDAYQAGLQKLANLDCQILVTPHPSASNMRDRLSTPGGLIDPKGCMVYADNVSKRLKKRLFKEQDQ